MPPPRKCSREDCAPKNTLSSQTVNCFCCKGQIHLSCYGVLKFAEEIFVSANIVMICDECLTDSKEQQSPKRKQSTSGTNLVQYTIDPQNPTLSLSKTAPTLPTPPKNSTVKQNQQTQAVIELLVQEIKTNTETIAGLKNSVDSMKETISEQKATVGESIRLNEESYSTIKQSYANILKNTSQNDVKETPRSTRPFRTQKPTPKQVPKQTPKQTPKPNKPTVSGTSEKVIGKPPSPNRIRLNGRSNTAPKSEKAIWVSRLHRDTTEEELSSYIKDAIGITSTDQYQVRKLVKKDKELSSYSFVSFKITCPVNMFHTLMDVKIWPNYSQIREFDLDQKISSGIRLNQQRSDETEISQSKNEMEKPSETQPHQGEVSNMEMA